MSNELVKKESQDVLADLQNTEQVVKALMASKHYAKMGSEGIYAIVQKAKSMGISPMDALSGGIYYVQGKCEMSSQMMNRLIRSKGHSIQKDPSSTNSCCILHGRRADNGDKWTVSFSIDDAKNAGLYKPNGPWQKYPDAMCFARALSMLARQLFPDVIVDTFVSGEISEAPQLYAPVVQLLSVEQVDELDAMVALDDNAEELTTTILNRIGVKEFEFIPAERYDALVKWIHKRQHEQSMKRVEKTEVKTEAYGAMPVKAAEVTADEAEEIFTY